MGFSITEKRDIVEILRSKSETDELRKQEIGDKVMLYLKNQNLLRLIKDFHRFPFSTHKKTKSENLEVGVFLNADFDLSHFMEQIADAVTPPVNIRLDCSFVLGHPSGNTY